MFTKVLDETYYYLTNFDSEKYQEVAKLSFEEKNNLKTNFCEEIKLIFQGIIYKFISLYYS